MMALRVGVVGLGIMGSAYAGHLIDAGFSTAGYDVAADALHRLAARGGRPLDSAKAVASQSDVILSALPNVAAVDAAFFGDDGIVAGAAPGLVVLEAGTFSLDVKDRIRRTLADRNASVLDTPVSGTGSQAATKDLVFFASGERAAFEKARAVLSATARDVRYVGEFGNGSKLKYIANLLVTIHNLSTAEALVLAQKSGLDSELVLDALADSAASSRMLQIRGPMMARGRYEPATMKIEVYQKDIEIIDAFAKSLGAPTPLFSASMPFYTRALAQGRGKQDTAAIASVLKEMAGLAADP